MHDETEGLLDNPGKAVYVSDPHTLWKKARSGWVNADEPFVLE